jgi:hypothetical protein
MSGRHGGTVVCCAVPAVAMPASVCSRFGHFLHAVSHEGFFVTLSVVCFGCSRLCAEQVTLISRDHGTGACAGYRNWACGRY